ncbi:MAG: hypothetical protein Q8M94_12890 [Ignavibacteria bacterium]|nr:hypothetical protein [Ignavibacteria bacterium]
MSNMVLKVYDVLGKEVATLVIEKKKKMYHVHQNASNLPDSRQA